MKNENKSIQTQLDSCRPGHPDWLAEEMRELRVWLEANEENREIADSFENFDSQMRNALDDVPVPTGLADQLKSNLSLSNGRSSANSRFATEACEDFENFLSGSNAICDEEPSDEVQLESESQKAFTKRALIVAGSFAGLAALLLISLSLLGVFSAGGKRIAADDLGRSAIQWCAELQDQSDEWQSDLDAATRKRTSDLNVLARSWRAFAVNEFDRGANVFDHSPNGGNGRVWVFSIKTKNRVRLSQTTFEQIYSIDGFIVGAKQNGDQLYVVVVEGNKRRFYQMLKQRNEIA